jgi:transcriptional regulator with XRE-family HTH domain
MDAGTLLRVARRRGGLSKRALARRARTSPAAIVEYERSRRSPTFDTFERLLTAAGVRVVVSVRPLPIDPQVAARRLADVLDLAEHLPHRPAARQLRFPPLPHVGPRPR